MLTPELMLAGYAKGIFPMAESRDDDALHWVDPRLRGILPLDGFHMSRSLRRRILREPHEIRVDATFSEIVAACAARAETWINTPLMQLYDMLHARGHAHSLGVWQDGTLTGGVFGVTLGRAFFGESMFSIRSDASKIALAYLVDRLRAAEIALFDTQFVTPHLASLGAVEISRADYHSLLAEALEGTASFTSPKTPSPQLLVQRSTQMS
ncbi:Leucyl/phenylalanyl-tRNA--protein transferase [Defluviimonas aquaemixtae]|uniref:Leucyl/phenylalanyl-tRNA--protein transferase n=1 Tax=Albidovulum aquaemixtae TaxID=1542388 RepID=A0A2R8B742_9RHOB|nr:leucyl/phenylalanyl-tRNA--protein transferase [Defluviimonas aquaemixtae]SPH18437.1 Leucyl/phenylalanyl-tRNA--protein transferase [Defluviimonas aquaemixtae]